MAYAFWMWSRMKVLGLLDNLRVCSKVKCPMKYKSRRNSSKISFANWASEFRLKSDIANFSPQYSSSKWSRHHWLCLVSLAKLHIPEPESAARAGSGRILCSGLGNVFLDRFKLLCTQMSCRCFVLPPWTTCVAAGASATPVPRSGGWCVIDLLLTLGMHPLLSWQQSRASPNISTQWLWWPQSVRV